MPVLYRLAADAVVVVHFAYVAFVVVGLLAILIGVARRRPWARNFWFRTVHLLAIGVVAAEAICGVTCPLTTWEQDLRSLAGESTYRGDFLATWAHHVLFFNAPPWFFTICHLGFALLVLATFVLAPPRWPWTAPHQGEGSAFPSPPGRTTDYAAAGTRRRRSASFERHQLQLRPGQGTDFPLQTHDRDRLKLLKMKHAGLPEPLGDGQFPAVVADSRRVRNEDQERQFIVGRVVAEHKRRAGLSQPIPD